jgi:hypothetical protein
VPPTRPTRADLGAAFRRPGWLAVLVLICGVDVALNAVVDEVYSARWSLGQLLLPCALIVPAVVVAAAYSSARRRRREAPIVLAESAMDESAPEPARVVVTAQRRADERLGDLDLLGFEAFS